MAKVDQARQWGELRDAYRKKNELFVTHGREYVDAHDFYREVFAPGFLEEAGAMVDWDEPGGGRPNAIALEVCGTEEGKDGRRRNVVRRHTITDGLAELQAIREHSAETNSFCFMSPVSYFGKNRTAANARFLHAFAVDLDGVGPSQCEIVCLWCERGVYQVPPDYVVNSGTGLHLYWVLEEPVPLIPKNVPGLQLLKRHVTERVWTEDTSAHEARQYQGIYQGFRMPNTSTKLNGAPGAPKLSSPYEAVCWRNPNREGRTALSELVGWVHNSSKSRREHDELVELMETGGRTPLEVARRKWPEWYERRVVEGRERGCYVVKRDLYDWWLRQVRKKHAVEIHHRYWCVFALASFANKCGISQEELEEDAFSLVDAFRELDTADNPFTEEDVLAALDAFEDGRGDGRSRRYTRAFLERKTAIPMPAKKRNGRSQQQHMRVMSAVRDIDYPDGSWRYDAGRPKGSPNKSHPKRDAIIAYAEDHPDATQREIASALGVSKTTVNKWLKVRDECQLS